LMAGTKLSASSAGAQEPERRIPCFIRRSPRRSGHVAACGGTRYRIVIADDHALVRLAIRSELEEAGFDICGEAATGRDALEVSLRERPDLCVFDERMPGGDGDDAAEAVRAELPNVKIVLLTATPTEEGALAAARVGASGYVGKDIAAKRLAHVLNAVVNGEAAYPRRFLPRLVAELSRKS
jgi:DNA-binding NarL/FixJ family response regulator